MAFFLLFVWFSEGRVVSRRCIVVQENVRQYRPNPENQKNQNQTTKKGKTKKKPHVQTRVRPINPPSNHFPVSHKNTPDRRLVAAQRQLRHVDGLAHETRVVLAVGDRAEDHFVAVAAAAGEVRVWVGGGKGKRFLCGGGSGR